MIKITNKFKLANSISLELTCFAAVIVAQLLLGKYVQGFLFFDDYGLRRFAIVLSIMPVVTLYSVTRFFLPPLVSAALICSCLTIISIANHVKTALTNIPLSYSDLVNTSNMPIIGHYITLSQIFLIAGFLLIIAMVVTINPYRKASKLVLTFQCLAFFVSAPLSLYPYAKTISPSLDKKVGFYFNQRGISYVSWSWVANISRNGLPLHFIQTAVSNVPPDPSSGEITAFDKLLESNTALVNHPNNIIIILCEACWHDDRHFFQPFAALKNLGFKSFNAVSPSYGGNTTNASFELHTGLPAKGITSGVIFTEYFRQFSNRVHTFPQHLKMAGYKTIAIHNFNKAFWHRDFILPKFGFDRFISIEDMPYKPQENTAEHEWPDDGILYEAALNILQTEKEKKFLFLTTVHTHGDYKYNNDQGELDYYNRLTTSIIKATDFAKKVIVKDPDSLIFIVGDHKPALTKFFYDNKIIPSDQFNPLADHNKDLAHNNADFLFSVNASAALIGDMPAYIYHSDSAKINDFLKKANGKPFFCVSQILNESFTQTNTPAFKYAAANNICEHYQAGQYNATVDKYPSWLYSLSLFDKRANITQQ